MLAYALPTVAPLAAAALSIALVLALRHLIDLAADGTFTREALARSPWVANAHRRVTASLTAAGTVLAIALASTILLGDLPLTASVVPAWPQQSRSGRTPVPASTQARRPTPSGHVDLTPRRPFRFLGPLGGRRPVCRRQPADRPAAVDRPSRLPPTRPAGRRRLQPPATSPSPSAATATCPSPASRPPSRSRVGTTACPCSDSHLLLAALVYGKACARTPRQAAEGACVDARFRHLSASLMMALATSALATSALAWQLSLMSALDALAFWTASVQVTIGDAAAVWQPTPPLPDGGSRAVRCRPRGAGRGALGAARDVPHRTPAEGSVVIRLDAASPVPPAEQIRLQLTALITSGICRPTPGSPQSGSSQPTSA